jgi:UDP-2,3-diacylglucosamine hydrolase
MVQQRFGDRLGIIAGNGRLPLDIAVSARARGEDPFVLVLKGETLQDWSQFPHAMVSIADMAGLVGYFEAQGIGRVVMSGGVSRRPGWRDIRPTWRAILKVPAMIRTLAQGGDNALLSSVITLIESCGCKVLGVHDVVPGLLAQAGNLGSVKPAEQDLRDIDSAKRAALMLGALDIGQGAVAVGGRVIALEGAEGTDSMLERVAELRRIGRISRTKKGVLVKMCKPQQDMRADLPAIGMTSIQNAASAGLAGIAIEVGRSLVLDHDNLIETADRLGLFVVGIEPDGEA